MSRRRKRKRTKMRRRQKEEKKEEDEKPLGSSLRALQGCIGPPNGAPQGRPARNYFDGGRLVAWPLLLLLLSLALIRLDALSHSSRSVATGAELQKLRPGRHFSDSPQAERRAWQPAVGQQEAPLTRLQVKWLRAPTKAADDKLLAALEWNGGAKQVAQVANSCEIAQPQAGTEQLLPGRAQQACASAQSDTRRARGDTGTRAAPPGGRKRRNANETAAQEAALQDQPAHVSSLAKRKLLHKSEASMVNFVQVNGRANLVCDIQAANSDDLVALILWYKDDSLAPIYTVDARKVSSLEKAKSTFDEQYSSRISFNHRTKPAQLELEQVRQEDEGEYRCRVDFKRGRTVNTIISLRVVIPPSDLSIVLADELHRAATKSGAQQSGQQPLQQPHKLSGLIGPFNEGDELQLACLAHGGKPRPRLTWRRDFNQLDSVEQNVDKEGTSVILKIPSLNKNHLLSIFTCQATNSNLGSSTLQSSITLDLNLKPEEVILKQVPSKLVDQNAPPGALLAGQTALFECSTHGSRPQASLHWLFQGHKHEPPMSVEQQQTSSRLELTVQRSHNQQPLTCVAKNEHIPLVNGSLSRTLKLDVHYPPQLSIKLEAPSNGNAQRDEQGEVRDQQHQANIQEGNDIYLTCQLDANPRPAKPILWRFNGRPLQSSGGPMAPAPGQPVQTDTDSKSNPTFVVTNQSLVLRKVTRHQSGAYTCEATNQHGTNVSRPLELDIRHAPVCLTSQILIYEASPGQAIFLDCGVQANPSKSVHYSWFASFASAHEQQNVSDWLDRDAAMDEQIDESSPQLKLRIRDQSSVLVKCKAKNEVGLQQRACHFQITRARIPTLRHSCSLASQFSSSLLIGCKQNEHLKTEQFQMNSSESLFATTTSIGHEDAGSELSSRTLWNQFGGRLGPLSSSLSLMRHNATEAHHRRRIVFAPNWLLAELYRARLDSHEASEQQQQEQTNYELVAYVVVAASEQLARIKELVEENKLFKENPRDIYYVAARANQTDSPMVSSVGSTIPRPLQILDDQSAQLANEFQFSIPSLQPETRYKLLIYGQNLANRTRDWLVVRGETGAHETAARQQQQQHQGKAVELEQRPSNNLLIGSNLRSGSQQQQQQDEQADATPTSAAGGGGSPPAAQLQKSIVMRSGEQEESQQQSDAELSGATSQVGKQMGDTQNSVGTPLGQHQLMEQLFNYRDFALSYAKRRPLLAVPVALIVCVSLCLLLIYLASSFVALLRRQRRSPSGRRASINRKHDRGDDSSNDCKRSPSDDDRFAFAAQANGNNSNASSTTSVSRNTTQDSEPELRQGAKTMGNNLLHFPSRQQASASPAVSFCSSSNGADRTTTTTSGALVSPATQRTIEQQRQCSDAQPGAIYTLDPASIECQLLNAIALEPLTVSASSCYASPAQGGAKLFPLSAAAHEHYAQLGGALGADQQHNCQLLGSLDRRWQQPQHRGEQFYLTEQQLAAQFGGSIDRRTGCDHGAFYEHVLAAAQRQQYQKQAARAGRALKSRSQTHEAKLAATTNGHSRRVVAFDLGDGSQYQTGKAMVQSNVTRSVTSGGGAGGNTAVDSGHESPGTNTTTNGDHHQQQQQQQQPQQLGLCQRHTQLERPLAKARQKAKNQLQTLLAGGGANVLLDNHEKQTHENGGAESALMQQHQASCLMLMEMSPGSQEESSTTLMHSADCSSSLNSSQLNACAPNGSSNNLNIANNYSILQQNHRMATSFATATSNGQQKSAKEQLEHDHWI